VIKGWRMSFSVPVAGMIKNVLAFTVMFGTKQTDHLGDPRMEWKIMLKWLISK
jgi:hypothetical protein